MARYSIRPLESADFATLQRLEEEIFGQRGDSLLGPYYVRLCCDFFQESCFLALDGTTPAGYLLCFLKGRDAYCTTLAVQPAYQRTRVVVELLRALVQHLLPRADSCWFTVEEDNVAARALHKALGARDTAVRPDFYGPGVHRIVSRIDREGLSALRARYERLGLLEPGSAQLRGAA